MRKVRTAIIGTGFMGSVHAENIRRVPNVELVAVAGLNDDMARSFGESIGVERTTGDYKTLLADPSIDSVHVLTPNAQHFPMSKAALLAGKAVLCEKPLAMNVAEAQELADLADKLKLANCTNHNLRCYPVVQHVR